MVGLIFLMALAGCFWFFLWIANKLSSFLPSPIWRRPVKNVIFLMLLASPFVDEVIGMHQFDELCKANGLAGVNVSKARGKRVVASHSDGVLIDGTIMPILVNNDTFYDVNSGEVVIQSKDYYAMGGWVMRYTPFSMGRSRPMLFNGNGCGLSIKYQIFSENQIVQVN